MIDTDRLHIRPIVLSDAPYVKRLMSTDDFIRFIGKRDVETITKTEDYIREKMLSHREEYGYGNNAIIRKGDGSFIGTIGLFKRPGQEGVDIGYAIMPQYYRQGYTTEAAISVLERAKNRLGLPFIDAFTMYDNIGSIKIIEKLGLSFLKEIKWDEDSEPSPMYRIVF